jgi:hypothetical protein
MEGIIIADKGAACKKYAIQNCNCRKEVRHPK